MSLFTAEELEELHRVSGCVEEEEPGEVECLPTGVQAKKAASGGANTGNGKHKKRFVSIVSLTGRKVK